jgi:MFS family permease
MTMNPSQNNGTKDNSDHISPNENDEIRQNIGQPIDKTSKKSLFNPSMIVMVAMVILVGTGEKLAERFLPLYLIALGGSSLSIGLLNGMDNLLSALYSFPGGYLSDKIGYKKSLIIFNIMAMIGFLIVILISTWWAVLIGALFFISWTAISLPAIMSLVADIVPKTRRTMGVTIHSLTRRIPMAIGPIIGGALIGASNTVTGIRIAFSIALGLGAISIVLEILFIKEDTQKHPTKITLKNSLKNISPNLRNLLISDILIRFAEQIPYAFAVVWAVNINGITALQFGILIAIEMATAMLIYIPVAYFADRSTKKPFVVITFIFFTMFPLVLIFCRSFPLLIIAFIIRGLKEFGEPTRKALIMDLAPERAKANTFGTYYLIRDVIVSLAAFGGAFLWNINPIVNFAVATVFGILGTIYFAIYGKDLNNK